MPDIGRKSLSATEVRRRLRYNKRTGIFHWRIGTKNGISAGAQAGCVDVRNGYIRIKIDGVLYLGHRLAWLYVTGEWPKDEVDHKNRNRCDTRWRNLREATHQQQTHNASAKRDGASPLKGAARDDPNVRRKKWRARITVSGKKICLGRHETQEAAHAAYAAAAKKYYGEFAHA